MKELVPGKESTSRSWTEREGGKRDRETLQERERERERVFIV